MSLHFHTTIRHSSLCRMCRIAENATHQLKVYHF